MAGNALLPDWLQSLLLLLFLGLAIILAFQQASELKRLQRPAEKKVYSVVECGDREHTRQFREGDYVGARVPCDGEGEGRIVKIYAVVPEEGKKPMKT